MDYDRNDALLHWLFRQTQGDAWFRPNEHNISSGVALRISDVNAPTPDFRVFPYETPSLEPFETAVVGLNPIVAIKVRNAAVHAALANVPPDDQSIYVDSNTRIQILDTMLHLPAAEKEQCAAFIRDERVLVVWSDALDRIIPLCTDFEERLIKLLWRAPAPSAFSNSPSVSHAHGSFTSGRSSVDGSVEALNNLPGTPSSRSPNNRQSMSSNNRHGHPPSTLGLATPPIRGRPHPATRTRIKRNWYGKKIGVVHSVPTTEDPDTASGSASPFPDVDVEKVEAAYPPEDKRRNALYAPFYNGLAAALSFVFIGNGIKVLLQEWTLDGQFIRFALVAVLPLLYCISLFFALQIIQNVSMVIGPIEQYHTNSTYYSAQKPRPNHTVDNALPHITIQMPVYKESLETVLAPSIASLKKAIQTYARQGGTASIFINDDGLRILPQPDREARMAFYALHGIGWIARPEHGDTGEGENEGEGEGIEAQGESSGKGKEREGELEKGETKDKGKNKKKKKGEENVEGAFLRAGRFKKASNMNYALALSLKMERHLQRLLANPSNTGGSNNGDISGGTGSGSSADDHAHIAGPSSGDPKDKETHVQAPGTPHPNGGTTTTTATTAPATVSLEEQALALAIEETWMESGRRHRAWAANARATRIGELVLLVDSDTVVPEDCLRDAAREMSACPTVAIIQHESDVMQVAHHYFENGIAYFTRRINRCISLACANGEIAPFMGHNAFLRWRAIQDAAFVDPVDGKEKIWSESNVSEDFDMALRLMMKGYLIRWATYSKGEFKEGVSLSVDDELNRWQKYSYGCSELLFNPFAQWFRRGPISHQIHTFMWSCAPMHYKISMMAYMFSYYGIAAGVTISVINYVLLGFQFDVDGFYSHSFEIWLATTVVFYGSGTVGYSILQYRLGFKQLIPAFLENLMWIPFFFFFFGGLSIPISQAILAHMFSYDISWSATIKEVQRSNFFKEIPKIAKRFWFPMTLSIVLILGMIICSTSLVPLEWRVDGAFGWAVIFPVAVQTSCHILFPIVLNPWLMVFSY